MPSALLDSIAAQLREWRVAAGSPSYAAIANRVGSLRSSAAPGRVTVYDCFRDGRARIDVELAVDIARALRIPNAQIPAWRARVVAAHHPVAREIPITMQRGQPVPVEPFASRLAGILPTRPVLLTGMPGVGKTQAAFDFARRLIARGQASDALVLGLRGSGDGEAPSADSIVDAARSALGIPATGTLDERAQLVGDSLRAQRILLIIDDASRSEQIEPLLPALVGVPLIMTSRVVFELPGTDHMPLSPWEPQELLELLARLVGAERMATDAASAQRIVAAAGGSPLAVAALAARVREPGGWTLADVAEELAERAGSRIDDAVGASMDASYPLLDPEAQLALRLFGVQPCADLSVPQLAALAGLGGDRARQIAGELEAAYLATHGVSGRIGMHALVRAFAAERSRLEDPPRVRRAALDRLAERMIGEAWSVTRARTGEGESRFGIQPVSLSDDELDRWIVQSVPPAAQLLRERADDAPAHLIEFTEAMAPVLQHTTLAPLALTLCDEAAGVADTSGDRVGQARALQAGGTIAVRLGEPGALERLEKSANIARETAEVRTELAATNALAVIAAQSGDLARALGHFESCLAVAVENEIVAAVPAFYDNVGIVRRRLGDLDGSLAASREGTRRAREAGMSTQEAVGLANASDVLLEMGDYAAAEQYARDGLDLARRVGVTTTQAFALCNLGAALIAQDRAAEAARALEEACEIGRTCGWVEVEAAAHTHLGRALLKMERAEDAAPHFERSLAMSDEYVLERGRALHGLGLVAAARGDEAAAREYWERALEAIGDASAPEAAEIRESLGR